MSALLNMVLDDPSSFHLLTIDMKERIIEAAINKVNIQAGRARKLAVANIRRDFTLRNSWTIKNINFRQMPKGRYALSAIQATAGLTEGAAYMKRQEEGGIRTPLKGKTLAIPTIEARGGSWRDKVKKKYYVSHLVDLKVRGKFKAKKGTPKSRQVARAAVAFRERKLIHYGKDLFFVDDFVARDGRVSFKTRQLYDLSHQSTITRPNPWFLPAVNKTADNGPSIFASEMKKAGF